MIFASLHEDRPKITTFGIAADTSVGAQFHDLPSTPAFSTSKNDLDHGFMMCENPNWLCYGLVAQHNGHDGLPVCELCDEKNERVQKIASELPPLTFPQWARPVG